MLLAVSEEGLLMFAKHETVDKRWLALCRESDTAAGMLEVGIRTLAHADSSRQNLYYAGFFNVTIAMERVCKLVLESKKFYEEGEFLKKGELSNYGHSLIDLYQEVQKIEEAFSSEAYSKQDKISANELKDILTFLTDFAKKDRYYNLESLTKNGGADPIKRWKQLILRYHPMPELTERQREEMRKADMHGEEEGVYVDMLCSDAEGNNIEKPSEWLRAEWKDKHVQNEGVPILYSISRYLSKVLDHFSGAYPVRTRVAEKKLDKQFVGQILVMEKMKIRKGNLQLPYYSDFFDFFEHDNSWVKDCLLK